VNEIVLNKGWWWWSVCSKNTQKMFGIFQYFWSRGC